MFENYSRENFEKAEKNKQKIFEKIGGPADLAYPLEILEHILAERKVRKFLGKSQAEAEKLNEEYEQLKQKVIDDIETLRAFEKEKLGVQEKDAEESGGQ